MNYSTEEHIVGTFNGENVYEITYCDTNANIPMNRSYIIPNTITSAQTKLVLGIEQLYRNNGDNAWFASIDGNQYGASCYIISQGVQIGTAKYTLSGYVLTIRYLKN